MRTPLFSAAVAIVLTTAISPARAADITVDVFYDQLEPYGEWVSTADYGYVWHPRDIDAEWRPYTVGSWAYTDAGWTWISDEPFGWATYHYGRWLELESLGWAWVPDTEWAPAWVSWRSNDRYVGWAPLPPEARFESNIGFHGWVDAHYEIGPAHYSFVRMTDFGAPRLRAVVVPPRENITIVNETRNITNITSVNHIVVNQGPEFDVLARSSSQPIRKLRLERETRFTAGQAADARRAEVRGDTLRVLAPSIAAARDAAPKDVRRKLDRAVVSRGWRDAGDPQQVEQLRARIAREAPKNDQLPRKSSRRSPERTDADAANPAERDRSSRPVPIDDAPQRRATTPATPNTAPAPAPDATQRRMRDRSVEGNDDNAPRRGPAQTPGERPPARMKTEEQPPEPAPRARVPGPDQPPTRRAPENDPADRPLRPEALRPGEPAPGSGERAPQPERAARPDAPDRETPRRLPPTRTERPERPAAPRPETAERQGNRPPAPERQGMPGAERRERPDREENRRREL